MRVQVPQGRVLAALPENQHLGVGGQGPQLQAGLGDHDEGGRRRGGGGGRRGDPEESEDAAASLLAPLHSLLISRLAIHHAHYCHHRYHYRHHYPATSSHVSPCCFMDYI